MDSYISNECFSAMPSFLLVNIIKCKEFLLPFSSESFVFPYAI
jgi:hypothetical protein